MKNINPTTTRAWKHLKHHFSEIKNIQLNNLFQCDKKRFSKYSLTFQDSMIIDFSKNRITDKTLKLLLLLADECYVLKAIQSMFLGKKINRTENRPVLHVALRNQLNNSIYIDNEDIMIMVHKELNKIKYFTNQIINGIWTGFTGKPILDVVNIGIGGSHLGPYMVTEALAPYRNHLNIHFISNINSKELYTLFEKINIETTIFLISSKSFKTEETLINAKYIKDFCLKKTSNLHFLSKHFFALSANIDGAIKFGISKNNIFQFWQWVGGRYSIWSASGLSIALSIGFKNFQKFLSGANNMDQHFTTTPLSYNIPVILALLSIWYTNFFYSETEAIMLYDEYLHAFPAYLQQSNMESNGKSIDRNGSQVDWNTGPIIWGGIGTNIQHSFFQLLHQSTKIIPSDFIISIQSSNVISNMHKLLFSNFLAQTKALAFGSSLLVSSDNFIKQKSLIQDDELFFSFKQCLGNKPTNSIIIKKITPYSLGALIALYEHKIFVQGIIWNIYSFDQWGVELGKNFANNIYKNILNNINNINDDVSTTNLINIYRKWNI